MFCFAQLVSLAACASLAAAHTVIVYPGWRGNNIHTNGTVSQEDASIKPGSLGINYENGTYGFPYGMQWMYPCGGMPMSTNRTKWPISGGAVSLQPGWFPGHSNAQFYVNFGYGTEPLNYSHPAVPVFSIIGPSNTQYNGTFCLPQIPMPAGFPLKVGDNATIQVIELAQHGASLYNCADITFAEDGDPEIPNVNHTNCYNSTEPGQKIGFEMVYTTTPGGAAPMGIHFNPYLSLLAPLVFAAVSGAMWL